MPLDDVCGEVHGEEVLEEGLVSAPEGGEVCGVLGGGGGGVDDVGDLCIPLLV